MRSFVYRNKRRCVVVYWAIICYGEQWTKRRNIHDINCWDAGVSVYRCGCSHRTNRACVCIYAEARKTDNKTEKYGKKAKHTNLRKWKQIDALVCIALTTKCQKELESRYRRRMEQEEEEEEAAAAAVEAEKILLLCFV